MVMLIQATTDRLILHTFPEGKDDAVTITTNDLDGLQPMKFLGNNMIDFYIK
jgi:Ulp1 family protease